MKQLTIYEAFEKVVKEASKKCEFSLHYEYGDYTEINNALDGMGLSPLTADKRFPLVWLLVPIKAKVGDNNTSIAEELTVTYVIAHHTDPNLTSKERKEQNFDGYLYPALEAMDWALLNSLDFSWKMPRVISYDKTDQFFWGRNNKLVVNDYIDAILVENLTLRLKKTPCKIIRK